jgi:AraC-like DNA-binding protein
MAFQSRLLPEDVIRRLCYYRRAADAVAFAHTRLDRPVRLDDVAALCGMTTTAFSRYFAAKIGMTYSNVIKILRIERALGQLETEDAAISDLAEQIGYQSCCTFSRAFKEVMGQTPSEYRRLILLGAAGQNAR